MSTYNKVGIIGSFGDSDITYLVSTILITKVRKTDDDVTFLISLEFIFHINSQFYRVKVLSLTIVFFGNQSLEFYP